MAVPWGKERDFYFEWPLEYLANTPNTTLLQRTAWADPLLSVSEDSDVQLHRMICRENSNIHLHPGTSCLVDLPALSPPACLAASYISVCPAWIINNGFTGISIKKQKTKNRPSLTLEGIQVHINKNATDSVLTLLLPYHNQGSLECKEPSPDRFK